jgi:oligoribonuclease NrnB/cAMP/cGMP phosphodiesterase (DHH superfamily)
MKYRLVTRPDFDGVVCGALLEELDMLTDAVFVHPRQMQDGTVDVGNDDIIANLPFRPGAHLVFDHHASESERVGQQDGHVIVADAPSTARVVYDHYGGAKGFPNISGDLIEAVDTCDSAAFTAEDLLAPQGWHLLHFVLDPRTGLEDFRTYATPRDEVMRRLMTYCRHTPVDEILQLPDIVDRVDAFVFNSEFAELQIERCSRMDGDIVITDYRGEKTHYPGHRFLVYGLHPDSRVSISLRPGLSEDLTEIAAGKSIIDRSSTANLGSIMLAYGGGGHPNAATCQVAADAADAILADIVKRIKAA